MDNDNPGGTSICHDYGGEYESIDIITIDSMALDRVDFIKIDIEGYEYEALLWMKKLLIDNQNIQIVFEWSPQFYEKLSEDGRKYSIGILKYLEELGFVLHELDIHNEGKKKKITNFDSLYDAVWTYFGAHVDIYAVRERSSN